MTGLRRRLRAWFESRLPRTDTWTLTQRNVYIVPTRAGFMFALVLHMLYGVREGTRLYNRQDAVLGAQGLSAEARAELNRSLAVQGRHVVAEFSRDAINRPAMPQIAPLSV